MTHAAQIDLRFGDPAREFLNFGVGFGPAISRASASTYKNGSEHTGRLNPWRNAFRAARARPRAVFGPVLARAFARLALILRLLVKPRSSLWSAPRSLQTRRPRSLGRSVAAFRQRAPDAVRSRSGHHCGGSRRLWLGGRSARCSQTPP
jgi:hypothetical protein